MSRQLRRWLAGGLAATAVDAGGFLILVAAGWPWWLADAGALSAAAAVAYSVNRTLLAHGDPYREGVFTPRRFIPLAVVAGLTDLGVLALAGSVAPWPSAKGAAVAVAGLFRLVTYRVVLRAGVRAEQQGPRSRPAPEGDRRLSVVVPAFREADRIGATVAAIREALAPLGDAEIIVVDDGSGDATAEEARSAGADIVLRHPRNRGKGAALRTGVAASSGRVVAFCDADLSYPPSQLVDLARRVEEGWDMVVGSRRHTGATTLVRARRLRELGGRIVNLLTHIVLLGSYRDTQCGIKAFRGDVARSMFAMCRTDRFAIDVELFHIAERHHLSLLEVPVTVINRDRTTVRAVADGLGLLADVLRIRRRAGRGAYEHLDVPAAEHPGV